LQADTVRLAVTMDGVCQAFACGHQPIGEFSMPQTINTNLVSLNAQRNLSTSQGLLSTSMQRLSSGLRVNSAKDDAAGLAIAERMNAQVRGMSVAMRNANDAISLSQTAEGALGRVGDILQRMRELAVQSANGTNTAADRVSLNEEYVQLAQEATRTLGGTQFNGQNILAATGNFSFQIGANNTTNIDRITVNGFNWTDTGAGALTDVLGNAVLSGTDVGSFDGTNYTAGTDAPTALITDTAGAQTAISKLDEAINVINSQRATFGAVQNRFDNVISNLSVASENQSAARARIMDADYAVETSNLSRAQILQQAGNAMVAQANQLPQQVLALLR
jgi:flagellin